MAARFPGRYINTTTADDPMMIRTDMDKMGIGANNAGLPNSVNSGDMTIKHVGASLGNKEG